MPWIIIQLFLIIAFPYFSRRMHQASIVPSWLSPVVLCYGVGILLSNFPIMPLDDKLSTSFSEYSIIIAIPLLLYGTRLKEWLGRASSTLLSFGLCVLSGLIATTLAALYFKNQIADAPLLAGMLTGVYTGGTPNMQAIGLALGASQELIILVNAADVFWSGLYLLFLTSIGPKFYGMILTDDTGEPSIETPKLDQPNDSSHGINYIDSLKGIGLSLVIVGLSAGACLLIFGNLSQVSFIMLMLTTLSIMASFAPAVQRLESTFETGEYFLLIFCVALGMLADFSQIIDQGWEILLFTAMAVFVTIFLHLVFAYFFKIGRDLFLFTSVAAIYGPAFIGQIASITGNRQLIFSGISMGLLGYAIGNYLGIGLAYLLSF
jgi:uncharacterized membrane protein